MRIRHGFHLPHCRGWRASALRGTPLRRAGACVVCAARSPHLQGDRFAPGVSRCSLSISDTARQYKVAGYCIRMALWLNLWRQGIDDTQPFQGRDGGEANVGRHKQEIVGDRSGGEDGGRELDCIQAA